MFARLFLLLLIVPIVEFYLIIRIGSRIGFGVTLGIVVLTALLGATLTRAQGMRAWIRFQQASSEGRMPHREVLDGIMILLAGVVLLTPGFLTDAVGFLLLVPPVRAALRDRVGKALKGRVRVMGMPVGDKDPRQVGPEPKERMVEGKVIELNQDE